MCECANCSMNCVRVCHIVQVAIAEHLLVLRKLKGSVVILTPYRGQKQVVQDLVQEKHAKLQEYVYPKEKAGGTLYIRTINECQGLCSDRPCTYHSTENNTHSWPSKATPVQCSELCI